MSDTANPTEADSAKPTKGGSADDPGNPDQATAETEATAEAGPVSNIARNISIAVGVVLLGLVGLLAFAGGPDDDDGVSTDLLTRRTPEVSGVALDGRDFNIDNHRGSWVLVNFFATWCPGCVNEHDDLVQLEQWGRTDGDLQIVSVVFNDPVDRVEQFFAERGGTWPVLQDQGISGDFGVLQIPETFLVSPAGQVVLHVEGEVNAGELARIIGDLEAGAGSGAIEDTGATEDTGVTEDTGDGDAGG